MKKISPNTLYLVTSLFEDKGWEIVPKTTNANSLFNRFCERLKIFEQEEQNFIINLTKGFTRIKLDQYLEKFYDSLLCGLDNTLSSYNKVFIFPLLTPYVKVSLNKNHENLNESRIPARKTKSANFLYYMFESDDWSWITDKFIHANSIKQLEKSFNNIDSILYLVDDYIGSGETAIEACKEYLSIDISGQKISKDNIKIVSIAAQLEGIVNIKTELGIEVITNIKLQKGIEDSGLDKVNSYKLMDRIENKLNVKNEFKLGFGKSEGLITFLNKTPNNTFPVYWQNSRSQMAPFPRNKILNHD